MKPNKMKKPIFVVLFLLSILCCSSCKFTTKEVDENKVEEVETDTSNFEILEEEEL